MALTKITGQVVNTSTDLTVGVLTATTVSVGGTLTYEDVTNVDSVGLITARNGIEVTDKGVQVGTGATVDSAAANTLTFLTGGSERLRVDSSGLVGIKTASPAAPFHVYDATNNTIARLESGDATCRLQVKDSAGEVYVAASGDDLILATTSSVTERLRITSAGKVGINQASPSAPLSFNTGTGQKIELYNSGDDNEFGFGLESSELRICTGSGAFIGFRTGGYAGTERLRITSDGKFGFKTTSPNYTVDINGEVGITEGQPITWHNGSGSLSAQIFAQSDDSLVFRNTSVGAERMRLDSSGRLMLGTTTEGYAGAQTLTIAEGGNSGITIRSGTAQNGSIAFSDATSGTGEYDGFVQYRHATQDLVLATNATERLRLTSTGAMLVPGVYSGTTATGANVVVEPDGTIRRSTSSIKYKNNVTTLSDDLADKILECRAVSYTSKCEGDDNAKINYGLIAEEVYDVDPSLVFTDNGEPEGVQYDRFVPHLVNLVKRQKTQIETLEQRLTDAGL